jgi:hypothetical protein
MARGRVCQTDRTGWRGGPGEPGRGSRVKQSGENVPPSAVLPGVRRQERPDTVKKLAAIVAHAFNAD